MKAVILAAGAGTRLGLTTPKSLADIGGETILCRQLRMLNEMGCDPIIVTGFQAQVVMEAAWGYSKQTSFVYNGDWATTNTAKSLLAALKDIQTEDPILWMNGDVFCEFEVLKDLIESHRSFHLKSACAVDNSVCGEEEIKYTLNPSGEWIEKISKEIPEDQALGEGVGINIIHPKDLSDFLIELGLCEQQDYFEKAMENLSSRAPTFHAHDIGERFCCEVDFPEDLERVIKWREDERSL